MDLQISGLGLVPIAISAVAAVAATTAATAVATTTASAATTATTATEAAATTAASTVAATTTAAATSAAALFARAGFVDGECTAIVLLTVESGHRGGRFLVRGHFDESEAFASAGVTIIDDLSRHDLPMCSEQLLEFRAIDGVAQVPDI
jgi:hypothetical protein